MKILILTNKPPYPPKDGSSLATLNMAKGLAERGNSITVLAISTHKHHCEPHQIPIELKQVISFNLVEVKTTLNPIRGLINLFFSKKPYNTERFEDYNYKLKIKEFLTNNRFDIIQLEGLYLIPYINTIRELCPTSIVYRAHNVEHEIWNRLSINEKNWFKSRYYAILAKRIHRMEVDVQHRVDALVAIAKRDEQWFQSKGFNKPSITIPMGYAHDRDTKFTKLSINEPCFLGSLDWRPNQEGLLWFVDMVWPMVLKEFPNLNLHIAGRNASSTLIDKLKKESNIIIHGEVENSQDYLSKYSILIVPVLSGSGMRVKIVEGMMFGNVVVSTSIGIEGIDAINHEHVIIADKPIDFANEVIGLVHNPSYQNSIAEKAHIFAEEHFNGVTLTEKLESFYKQII